jgi:hypothetical protein
MIRRLGAAAAVVWFAAVAPLAAQAPDSLSPWRLSWFPYVTLSPNSGLMGVAHAILFRQAAYDDRVSLRDAVTLDAGYSTKEAWLVRVRGDFPRIADGWRLQATAEASHSPRFGDPDAPQDLSRQGFNADITRRIAGRLQLAVRGGVEHLRDDLPLDQVPLFYPQAVVESPCFLIDPMPGGALCNSASIHQTDATVRAAVVLDLRDREYNTLNGGLLEAGVFAGSAVNGYHGAYAMARGWWSPREATHLTARVGMRAMSSAAGVGISHTMPGWERPFTTLGGDESDRGLPEGRYAGRGLLLAGAEFRQDVVRAKNIFALSLLAFVDGGRAFQDVVTFPPVCATCSATGVLRSGGDLRLTLDDWSVSGGGGVAVRILRNAIVTVTAARGEKRTRWYVSSGWSW